MRIVFMGTPDFAVPSLRQIVADGHEVAGVFTQPDKPQGRKMILTPSPVKELAEKLGIPVHQPAKLRDGAALAILEKLAPELIVVVAYGKILPKEILDCPRLGCVNVHGSLLPKYRGAAPIQWTVINGDAVAGVTTMFMDVGMDTGDMILRAELAVGEDETAGELFERLAPLGARCLSDTLKLVEGGNAPRIPQNNEETTMAPMLAKEQGELDFQKDARTLHNLVRGLNPWPGAWIRMGEKTLKIHTAKISEETSPLPPGCVLPGKELRIVCGGGGVLELVTVQPEGKGKMSGGDYLRGARRGDDLLSINN